MTNPLPTTPLRKGAKQKYQTDKIAVIPDKVFIVRTRASGRKWSVLFYVPAAKQNKQFALHTTDIEVAKERALEQYFSVKKRIDSGEKLSAITAQELVDRYLAEEAKRVVIGGLKRGGIVPERYKTIQTALKRHFLPFVKPATKLGKIPESKFQEYVDYRRSKQSDVAISTLDNEMSMINKMLSFAKDKGLLHREYRAQFTKLPRNTQPYSGNNTGRRSEFTVDEWLTLGEYIDGWDNAAVDADDLYARQIVRAHIYILCFSGMRPSEARKLTWSMIEISPATPEKVKIHVPWLSKTGARLVLPIDGTVEFFRQVRAISKFTGPADFVFADRHQNKFISTRRLYSLWKLALSETKLDKTGKKLEYYSLRHTYCTQMLVAGTAISLLSQNMGTSPEQIERHYSHVKVEMGEDKLRKLASLSSQRKTPAARLFDFSAAYEGSLKSYLNRIPGVASAKTNNGKQLVGAKKSPAKRKDKAPSGSRA